MPIPALRSANVPLPAIARLSPASTPLVAKPVVTVAAVVPSYTLSAAAKVAAIVRGVIEAVVVPVVASNW